MQKNFGVRKKSEVWNLGSLIVPLNKNQKKGGKISGKKRKDVEEKAKIGKVLLL